MTTPNSSAVAAGIRLLPDETIARLAPVIAAHLTAGDKDAIIASMFGAPAPNGAVASTPGAPAKKKPGRKPKAPADPNAPKPERKSKVGPKRSAEDVTKIEGNILDFLAGGPANAEAISKAISVDNAGLKIPLRNLMAAHGETPAKVVSEGQKRSTKYRLAGTPPSAPAQPPTPAAT